MWHFEPGDVMDHQMTLSAHRRAGLAAIARREWLLRVLALAAAGCRRGDDRARSRHTTVTVGYKEKNLNPAYDEPDKRLVFLPLVIENQTGELEGRLAERWEYSADYREWIFHLRPGVRWHDEVPRDRRGREVQSRPALTPGRARLRPLGVRTGGDAGRDDRHRPVQGSSGELIPTSHGRSVIPSIDWSGSNPATIAGWDFWTHPLGNGPYRFVRYVPQLLIEFEANPEYYRGAPSIKRVRLTFSRQPSGIDLLSENVDQSDLLDARQAATLAADGRFRVYHAHVETSILTLWWQHRHPCFRDPRVREALTLAINRRELRQLLGVPDSIPLVDGPFSRRQLQRGTVAAALEHDPARARMLLDAAGWLPRGAGRARELDGRPFRFTAIVRGGEVTSSHAAAVYSPGSAPACWGSHGDPDG